jgi:hypothetical protein
MRLRASKTMRLIWLALLNIGLSALLPPVPKRLEKHWQIKWTDSWFTTPGSSILPLTGLITPLLQVVTQCITGFVVHRNSLTGRYDYWGCSNCLSPLRASAWTSKGSLFNDLADIAEWTASSGNDRSGGAMWVRILEPGESRSRKTTIFNMLWVARKLS